MKGRDELLKFPFSEDKGTVPRKAQRKHHPQLSSLPFLSPFLTQSSVHTMKQFGLIVFNSYQYISVTFCWSEVSVSDSCTSSAQALLPDT